MARNLQNFSVKGALNHAEAIELMREADVIVSASRDEAMPTVTILEAMGLGKALITTIVGGALEVLVEGENALLVRPEAPDALAAAIRRLIEDPALAGELGEKARETYEENFTMERFGDEFRQLIAEVMSDPLQRAAAQLLDAVATGPEIGNRRWRGRRFLFVSHETTLSGAPIQLVHLVRWLQKEGWELGGGHAGGRTDFGFAARLTASRSSFDADLLTDPGAREAARIMPRLRRRRRQHHRRAGRRCGRRIWRRSQFSGICTKHLSRSGSFARFRKSGQRWKWRIFWSRRRGRPRAFSKA